MRGRKYNLLDFFEKIYIFIIMCMSYYYNILGLVWFSCGNVIRCDKVRM